MSKTILWPLAGACALGLMFASSVTACGPDVVDPTGPGPSSSSSASSGGTGGTAGTTSTGGIGGTGAQGGGGMTNSGNDTCPGDPFSLNLGDTLNLIGDTSMASDDYTQGTMGCNGVAFDGPDNVYDITMSDAGTLTVDLASAGTLNPAMYLRASCDDSTTALWCNDFSTTLRTRKLHMDAGTYSLFVDGAGMTSGAYTLTLNLEPAACGDGVINPNTSEQCDDGNMDTGDGCDNCVLEPGSNDDCSNPLGPVVIQPSMPVTLSGTTTGNADNSDFVVAMQGCPANGNFLGGRDRVYALVPTAPGTMTIDIGYPLIGGTQGVCELTPTDPGCWNSVLYVRHVSGQSDQTACETQLSQVACEHQVVPNDSTGTASFTVEAGETYFVFVDSWWYDAAGGYTGPYWLHVNLQ